MLDTTDDRARSSPSGGVGWPPAETVAVRMLNDAPALAAPASYVSKDADARAVVARILDNAPTEATQVANATVAEPLATRMFDDVVLYTSVEKVTVRSEPVWSRSMGDAGTVQYVSQMARVPPMEEPNAHISDADSADTQQASDTIAPRFLDDSINEKNGRKPVAEDALTFQLTNYKTTPTTFSAEKAHRSGSVAFTSGSSHLLDDGAVTEASVRYPNSEVSMVPEVGTHSEVEAAVRFMGTDEMERTRATEAIASRSVDYPVTEVVTKFLHSPEAAVISAALRSMDADKAAETLPKSERIITRLLEVTTESASLSSGAKAESSPAKSEAAATRFLDEHDTVTFVSPSKVSEVEGKRDELGKVVTRILDSASLVTVTTGRGTNLGRKADASHLSEEIATSVAFRAIDLGKDEGTQIQGVASGKSDKSDIPTVVTVRLSDSGAKANTQELAPRTLSEMTKTPLTVGVKTLNNAAEVSTRHLNVFPKARSDSVVPTTPAIDIINRAVKGAEMPDSATVRYADPNRSTQIQPRRVEKNLLVPTPPSRNVDLVRMLYPSSAAAATTGQAAAARMEDGMTRPFVIESAAPRTVLIANRPVPDECFFPELRREEGVERSLERVRPEHPVQYLGDSEVPTGMLPFAHTHTVRPFGASGSSSMRYLSHPVVMEQPMGEAIMVPQRSSGMVQEVRYVRPPIDTPVQPMRMAGMVDPQYMNQATGPEMLATRPSIAPVLRYLIQAAAPTAMPASEAEAVDSRYLDVAAEGFFCDGTQPIARAWGETVRGETQLPHQAPDDSARTVPESSGAPLPRVMGSRSEPLPPSADVAVRMAYEKASEALRSAEAFRTLQENASRAAAPDVPLRALSADGAGTVGAAATATATAARAVEAAARELSDAPGANATGAIPKARLAPNTELASSAEQAPRAGLTPVAGLASSTGQAANAAKAPRAGLMPFSGPAASTGQAPSAGPASKAEQAPREGLTPIPGLASSAEMASKARLSPSARLVTSAGVASRAQGIMVGQRAYDTWNDPDGQEHLQIHKKGVQTPSRRSSYVNVDVNVRGRSSGRRRHHHHHHHERPRASSGVGAGAEAEAEAGVDVAPDAALGNRAMRRKAKSAQHVQEWPRRSPGRSAALGTHRPVGGYGDPAAYPFYGGTYGPLASLFMHPYADFYI